MIEFHILYRAGKTDIIYPVYFSTPIVGLGAFWVAQSAPNLGSGTPLPFLGRYSLGIYAMHGAFLGPCHAITRRLGWPFLRLEFLLVFGVTCLCVLALARLRILRPLLA